MCVYIELRKITQQNPSFCQLSRETRKVGTTQYSWNKYLRFMKYSSFPKVFNHYLNKVSRTYVFCTQHSGWSLKYIFLNLKYILGLNFCKFNEHEQVQLYLFGPKNRKSESGAYLGLKKFQNRTCVCRGTRSRATQYQMLCPTNRCFPFETKYCFLVLS